MIYWIIAVILVLAFSFLSKFVKILTRQDRGPSYTLYHRDAVIQVWMRGLNDPPRQRIWYDIADALTIAILLLWGALCIPGGKY